MMATGQQCANDGCLEDVLQRTCFREHGDPRKLRSRGHERLALLQKENARVFYIEEGARRLVYNMNATALQVNQSTTTTRRQHSRERSKDLQREHAHQNVRGGSRQLKDNGYKVTRKRWPRRSIIDKEFKTEIMRMCPLRDLNHGWLRCEEARQDASWWSLHSEALKTLRISVCQRP
jgi:hypothetical protein